jgi:hypothetical protein
METKVSFTFSYPVTISKGKVKGQKIILGEPLPKWAEHGIKKKEFIFSPFIATVRKKRQEVYYLIDPSNGNFVYRNRTKAGQVKEKIINGQDLHTCRLPDYDRASIIDAIKECFNPSEEFISQVHNLPFPLKAIFVFNTSIKQDIDNHALFYIKAIIDKLVDLKIIPNDTREYWNGYEVKFGNYTEENTIELCLETQKI